MHCVPTLFILCCVGTFFFAHGNINDEIADEIQRHISPLKAKYSEIETFNLENQKKIVELQNDILILKQENDLKTSDLLEVTQQLQRLTQAKLAPIHPSGDFCQYVDEQCPRKSREDRQATHTIAFSAYIDHLGGNNHVGNTLLYNKVLGNYGTGYDTNTGIFTAPESGIYGFLWVTQVHHGSWCSTRIERNGFILSMTASYAKAASTSLTENGSGTGFLITYMNRGDTASVAMNNPTGTPCNIVSNDKGLTTFSGWQIARI